jgi:O-antigen ligase
VGGGWLVGLAWHLLRTSIAQRVFDRDCDADKVPQAAMTFTSIKSAPKAATSEPDVLQYRIVLVLWVLYLFHPHRLIQHYAPGLNVVTWVLELLLYAEVIMYFGRTREWRGYPAFTIFIGLTLLGVVMGAIFADAGRSLYIVRTLYQPYLLALMTYAYCTTLSRGAVIIKIYFLHLLYFGLWGLASLYYAPIGAGDPGFRKIVYWHTLYDNRDAFGPLMAIGFVYSAYFYQATKDKLALLSCVLSLVGVVTSFGRGVFLSLIAACLLMFVRSKQKSKILLVVAAMVILGTAAAPGLVGRYAESMGTIFSEGTHKGTGADRKILWTWATRVFMLNPIAGVGPGNFGIAVFKVVPPGEAIQHGYTQGSLWGRALHSTPMTLLSEYGTLGILAIMFLIYDFFRSNNTVRRLNREAAASGIPLESGFKPEYVENIALALQTSFVVICINSTFYEIFYVTMLGHLISVNRLFYFVTKAHLAPTESATNRWKSFTNAGSAMLAKSFPGQAAGRQTVADAALSSAESVRPVMRGRYR